MPTCLLFFPHPYIWSVKKPRHLYLQNSLRVDLSPHPNCYHLGPSCPTLSLLDCCDNPCPPPPMPLLQKPEGPCQDRSQILSLHVPTFCREQGKVHIPCSRYLSGFLACLSPQPLLYSNHSHLLTSPRTCQAQPCPRAFACAVPRDLLNPYSAPSLPAQKSQRHLP